MANRSPQRFRRHLFVALLLVIAAAGVSISQSPAGDQNLPLLTGEKPPPAITAQRAKELEFLVHQDCGSCHGMTLKGGLGPDLRSGTLAGSDPDTLALIVLDGVPDSAMPPWRPLLSEADAHWIARYLLTGESP